jgi:TonB family protein
MRKAGWILPALVLPTLAGCTRQEIAKQKPNLPEPTATARSAHSSKADMAIPMCAVPLNDGPKTNGVVVIGRNGAKPPKLVRSVKPQLSGEAARLEGARRNLVLLSGVVGVDGNLKDVCLVKSVGYGLDAKAANAVRQYKFDPGTKDGKPVPTRITIEVDFQREDGTAHGMGA